MSDTHRRYYAIRRALLQLLPTEPTGHAARHFMTLVSLICGMIGSHSVQLPKIACCMPLGPQQRESHIKRIQRWLQNDRIDTGIHYLPYAQYIVQKCAQDQIIIAIDGSVVARGCVALMASMIYHNRALPLTWLVKSGKKGHFSEEMHCSILDQLKPIIPPQRSITIVGDGEFDNIEFLKKITAYGWTYVCRTASSTLIYPSEHDNFPIGTVRAEFDTIIEIPAVCITQKRYGPVHALVYWDGVAKEPIYLITTLNTSGCAISCYKRRFIIETFFSDQKSRGFGLESSHLRAPVRVQRLLLAACLAYVWIVLLGVQAATAQWQARIHRGDRCDVSLFQLGTRFLSYCLTEWLTIPETFQRFTNMCST